MSMNETNPKLDTSQRNIGLTEIHVLAAIKPGDADRYQKLLGSDSIFKLTVATNEEQMRSHLEDPMSRTDALILENSWPNSSALVKEFRKSYQNMAIILVDEDADFGMPGYADEFSATPFKNDDLSRKIKRLIQERRLETLRADALPPVRAFAKQLGNAGKGISKHQAAVEAIKSLGYDYVALYTITSPDPVGLTLTAQTPLAGLQNLIPTRLDENSLPGWVAKEKRSRIVGKDDRPSHPLIEKGKFGAAAAVAVGTTLRFGILMACREQAGSISPEGMMMLELIASQLAAALAKDART